MPLPDIGCAPEGEVCCDVIWGVAERLLTYVYNDLIACMPDDDCYGPALQAFVSHGEPQTAESDFLAVWLAYALPEFRDLVGGVSMVGPARVRATWAVRLIESHYPTFEADGDTIVGPSLEQLHAINRHVYGHGERLLRAVINGGMDTTVMGDCQKIGFGNLTAWRPGSGGAYADSVGYDITITATIDLR